MATFKFCDFSQYFLKFYICPYVDFLWILFRELVVNLFESPPGNLDRRGGTYCFIFVQRQYSDIVIFRKFRAGTCSRAERGNDAKAWSNGVGTRGSQIWAQAQKQCPLQNCKTFLKSKKRFLKTAFRNMWLCLRLCSE